MHAVAANPPSLCANHGSQVHPPLAEANVWCRQFARSYAENFTVASWLLPRQLRQPFANIYAWCRWADDLADETGNAESRLSLLDDWEAQLHRCAAGEAEHPIYVAIAQTLREYEIPLEPFSDLLAAFRQDQRQTRYETFAELLAYCRLSANSVGRLVLRLGRCDSAPNVALSDAICTGLQLVNFWQDVRRDWAQRGRIYLPRETMRQFQLDERVIDGGVATANFCGAIALELRRAEEYLHAGWPLVASVSPELRVEVELFIRSGLAVAHAIRRQRYDVLSRRPVVSKAEKLRLLAATLWRQKVARRHGAP